MNNVPGLTVNNSTLSLSVETKVSPLLGQFQSTNLRDIATSPTPVSTPSSTSSGTVCYICHCDDTEEMLLRNVCGCKKQVVHAKCLATWLHYSAARQNTLRVPHCEVCLQEFDLPLSVAIYAREMPPPKISTRSKLSSFLNSFGLPALLAFVYGFSSPALCNTKASTAYTCLFGNATVLAAWILFVVCKRLPYPVPPYRKSVQDIVILLCVYVTFLIGWMLQKWSVPHYTKSYEFATVHFSNIGCVVFISVARLTHAPCKACCQILCTPPPVSISQDQTDE